MQQSQNRRRSDRYRSAFVVGCLVAIACCEFAGAVAQARRYSPPPRKIEQIKSIDADACRVEIYAYLKVRGLAEELGPDGDILGFALDDLRAGLVECLSPARSSGESEIFDQVTPLDERTPLLRAIDVVHH